MELQGCLGMLVGGLLGGLVLILIMRRERRAWERLIDQEEAEFRKMRQSSTRTEDVPRRRMGPAPFD